MRCGDAQFPGSWIFTRCMATVARSQPCGGIWALARSLGYAVVPKCSGTRRPSTRITHRLHQCGRLGLIGPFNVLPRTKSERPPNPLSGFSKGECFSNGDLPSPVAMLVFWRRETSSGGSSRGRTMCAGPANRCSVCRKTQTMYPIHDSWLRQN